MAKINGKEEDPGNITLLEYLNKNNYNLKIIAVERNEEIVSKNDYEKVYIQPDDVIEIVSFVGGGWYGK